ncbi:hypothetical protein ACFJIX_00645 [Roseateles sp. UC29_93]|uniref:hypothetical protein n=1 Tax=Roseateles sp. UC29_93 TaxID=3350177 RepID=UPI00366CA142
MLDGEKPSTPFALPLLAKVLALKGRPPAVVHELALAMLAADTMDDQWTAGMLQAGVVHHGALSRLREAGVSPQDVALGNANRRRYEGSADRSGLVSVEASEAFGEPIITAYRYVSKYFLKLNDAGDDFSVKDSESTWQKGVAYDLRPGALVGEGGDVPKEHPDELIARHDAAIRVRDAIRSRLTYSGAHSPGPSLPIVPALPELVVLYKKGLVAVEEYEAGGAWDGRSQPQNLVDGFEGADEVVAWRPATSNPSPKEGKPKPDISVDPEKFIQFDFAHPIALKGLTLTHASSSSSPELSQDQRNSLSEWKVEARRKDGAWMDVSMPWTIRGVEHGRNEFGLIDTKGIPYRHYRLTGVSGVFPKEAWFSEVTFTTVEAGASPRPAVNALQGAGFGDEEIRSLFLLGLREEAQIKRAIDLRRHFGPLPLAVLMDDVQGHDSLGEEEIRILNELRSHWSDQRLRSSETLLEVVRLRAAGRHIDRLNAQLPFFDPGSVEDDEHRQFVAQIQAALNARRDPSAQVDEQEGDQDATADPAIIPFGPVFARHLVDRLRDRLLARHEEAKAMRVTAPWYLHLTALEAAAFDRTLHLRVRPGTSQQEAALRSVIEDALPRLQIALDHGLLDVVFVSSMPPVGEAAPWAPLGPNGKALHLSPGVDLVAEHREAQAGQPIPRLLAGGFTGEEAKALFERGVQTLEQVTRAIDLRKLFDGLSWKLVAENVLEQQPFDDGQLKLAHYLSSLPWWRRRPQASSAAVRHGLAPAQRTGLIDGLLPDNGHPLIEMSMLQSLVSKVRTWLHAAQDSDPQGVHASANITIALRLIQAAGGMNRALQDAIELAAKSGLRVAGQSTVGDSSAWDPQALRGFASLAPPEDGAQTVTFDAPLYIVLFTYERLLHTLDYELRRMGHHEADVAEALRPKYLDLAVLRAAVGGQQLRLHVPPGESPREQAFMALIEARLPALQKAGELDLLDVAIASPMPVVDLLSPWTTQVVDGKTWYLSSAGALEAAWRSGKVSQAIPVLMDGGFDAEDARKLYDLNVRTEERVTRAILLRKHFGALPVALVASDTPEPTQQMPEHLEQALGPHPLRLAALRAAVGRQPLRLQVPATGSPEDRLDRRLIEAALPFLEQVRRDGILDVAIVSSRPPVGREDGWTSQDVGGKTLRVSSKQPLEAAWREGLLGHPFHRLVAAGYGEDDAQALHDGGIQTAEQVDRAVQLHGFFGDLSPEVVLQDVLVNPPFSLLETELGSRLGRLLRHLGMDALGLVRGGLKGTAPMIQMSDARRLRSLLNFDDEIARAYAARFLEWLSETQGPEWSSDATAVTALAGAMGWAASGNWRALANALGLARGLGLLHHGQAQVVDADDWMPAFIGRHARLVRPDEGEQAPTMAAPDYVVLQGLKRLLDAVRSEHIRLRASSGAGVVLDTSYLHLQALRAVATGQRIELGSPEGRSYRDTELQNSLNDLRRSLEESRSLGFVRADILFEVATPETDEPSVPDAPDAQAQDGDSTHGAEDAASDRAHGGDSARQANLLKQAMSSHQEADFGGTSSFGVPRMPSPQALLSAQTT